MNFRAWCYEKWMEHCDEIEQYMGSRPTYTPQMYFSIYKWWLKREFIFQKALTTPSNSV